MTEVARHHVFQHDIARDIGSGKNGTLTLEDVDAMWDTAIRKHRRMIYGNVVKYLQCHLEREVRRPIFFVDDDWGNLRDLFDAIEEEFGSPSIREKYALRPDGIYPFEFPTLNLNRMISDNLFYTFFCNEYDAISIADSILTSIVEKKTVLFFMDVETYNDKINVHLKNHSELYDNLNPKPRFSSTYFSDQFKVSNFGTLWKSGEVLARSVEQNLHNYKSKESVIQQLELIVEEEFLKNEIIDDGDDETGDDETGLIEVDKLRELVTNSMTRVGLIQTEENEMDIETEINRLIEHPWYRGYACVHINQALKVIPPVLLDMMR